MCASGKTPKAQLHFFIHISSGAESSRTKFVNSWAVGAKDGGADWWVGLGWGGDR